MCPKIHTEKKEYESPEEVQALKILISTGDSYFKIQSLKVGINRQPLDFLYTIQYNEAEQKERGYENVKRQNSFARSYRKYRCV